MESVTTVEEVEERRKEEIDSDRDKERMEHRFWGRGN